MTDDEIRDRLCKADTMLAEYQRLVQPVADELAKQKEKVVGQKYIGKSCSSRNDKSTEG